MDPTSAPIDAGHDFSFVGLFLQADPIVKGVMILLVVASLACWTVVFEKVVRLAAARRQAKAFDALVRNPGPVVVGAAQGASCYGPAYEFAFILDKALRDARVRDRVPMTFVTAEPYVGHLGLDWVGDTKTLDVHVKRLRTKIEPDPAQPRYLITVRGLGYKFEGSG